MPSPLSSGNPSVIYDRIEGWDYDRVDSWETLDWLEVHGLRYRQHKPDGTVIPVQWLTDFSI